MATETKTRYGRALVKFNKTDCEFQTVTVRDERDGFLEFYDARQGRWFNLPAEWKRLVVWGNDG